MALSYILETITFFSLTYNVQVARSEAPRRITEADTTKKEAETSAVIAINKADSEARIALTRYEIVG